MADETHPVIRSLKTSVLSNASLAGLDEQVLGKAIEYAVKAHTNQTRASGEPYVTHPLEVALLVTGLGGSSDMVACALLHDTVEDTGATIEDIGEIFGKKIKSLVDGCTKVSKVHPGVRDMDSEAATLRKLFVSLAEDPRVVVIKICDRLHNMRTIDYLPEEKQKRIALETLAIHAPLAARIGLRALKSELEDRAFKVAYPQEYERVGALLAEDGSLYTSLMEAREKLVAGLAAGGLDGFEVSGRLKHRWSTYNKLRNPLQKTVYDLLGLRVVTESDTQCYEVLSVVNSLWKPVDGRYKDYISKPKRNSYKSLHTTVLTETGTYLEIQIRTARHHAEAEFGAASHHAYKYATNDEEWVQRLLDWSTDIEDPEEYIRGVKAELAETAEVVVYSPALHMHVLPKGATVVDFAYKVHTDIGHSCVGAKVNGTLVPLGHTLSSGDIVEIITGSRTGPSEEWLKWVMTPRARAKIKKFHARVRRDDETESHAEAVFISWATRAGMDVSTPAQRQKAVAKLGMPSLKELFRLIDAGKYVLPETLPVTKTRVISDLGVGELRAAGLGLCPVRRAGCCAGRPGGLMTGIVGRGSVVAHSPECRQGRRVLDKDPGRAVRVYRTAPNLQVETLDLKVPARPALHYEISRQAMSVGAEVLSHVESSPDGFLRVDMGVPASGLKILKTALRCIDGLSTV